MKSIRLLGLLSVREMCIRDSSTAVTIGAMLISPLMGPIMGVGLSVGLNDFELMK